MFQPLQPVCKHLRFAACMVRCGLRFPHAHLRSYQHGPCQMFQQRCRSMSSGRCLVPLSHSFIHVAVLLPPNHCGFIVSFMSDV